MKAYLFMNSIILLMFCLSVFGCSRGVPKDFPALYPCVITVHQDGTPLAEASVLFKPLQEDAMSASGITDKKGIAVIKTQAAFDGAPEGTYKVMIAKRTRERNPAVKDEDLNALDPTVRLTKEFIVTYLVDPKFGNAAQTPFEIQIQPGKNERTFDVTKPNQ